MSRNYRAFSLFSGGLDSLISVFYMKRLGYTVIPVFFQTPFFPPEKAVETAKKNCLDILVFDITENYIPMLKNPKYGYGRFFNPCIDCHGLMFKELASRMNQYKIDFLISGEVLGQRPMSQRKDALNSVSKLSGVKDLIIRPLSQKLLRDTYPITAGWVNKEEMLDIQGRGRYRQIQLAEELGIKVYPNPGGGCYLTDKSRGARAADLVKHNTLEKRHFKFLEYGRHFRINEAIKLIVGKNKNETKKMLELIDNEIVLQTSGLSGPLGVVQSERSLTEKELSTVCSIFLTFNNKANLKHTVLFGPKNKTDQSIEVSKVDKETFGKYWIK